MEIVKRIKEDGWRIKSVHRFVIQDSSAPTEIFVFEDGTLTVWARDVGDDQAFLKYHTDEGRFKQYGRDDRDEYLDETDVMVNCGDDQSPASAVGRERLDEWLAMGKPVDGDTPRLNELRKYLTERGVDFPKNYIEISARGEDGRYNMEIEPVPDVFNPGAGIILCDIMDTLLDAFPTGLRIDLDKGTIQKL